MAGDTAAVMAAGFVHLLVSQVATRLITFVLTLLTARLLSVEGYGFAAVQLHLTNTVILLLSREGFRRGCLRMPEGRGSTRRLLATAALCWPVGILTTVAVCTATLWRDDSTPAHAVLLQGLAALLELAAEPLYILAQAQLRFKLRVTIEAAANTAKALAVLALLRLRLAPELTALSLSQAAYGLVVLLGYVAASHSQMFQWLQQSQPDRHIKPEVAGLRTSKPLLDYAVLRLCGTFSLQAAEKLVLAEGSKLAMVLFQSSYNQGVYGLVVNLGSLVVRTIFQPFEEAVYLAFGRQSAEEMGSHQRQENTDMLTTAVKAAMAFGMLAAAFGPAYAYLALRIVYGQGWSETGAPSALALYSWYVCLLAVNGILESFQHAVATPSQLALSNTWLVGFSVLHIALSIGLVSYLQAQGLILADGLNMIARIVYSIWFIGQWDASLKGVGLGRLFLGRTSMGAYCAAFVICSASNWLLLGAPGQLISNCAHGCPVDGFWKRAVLHISVGAASFAAVIGALLRSERQLINRLQTVRRKQD